MSDKKIVVVSRTDVQVVLKGTTFTLAEDGYLQVFDEVSGDETVIAVFSPGWQSVRFLDSEDRSPPRPSPRQP